MAITLSNVLDFLTSFEPRYEQAAETLGTEALPHLLSILKGPDPRLAANAVFLAGFLATDRAAEIIDLAAKDSRRGVRVAAAASFGRLPSVPLKLATTLLNDPEAGVRKWALKSLERAQPIGFKAEVHRIAESDQEPALRQLAKQVEPQLR